MKLMNYIDFAFDCAHSLALSLYPSGLFLPNSTVYGPCSVSHGCLASTPLCETNITTALPTYIELQRRYHFRSASIALLANPALLRHRDNAMAVEPLRGSSGKTCPMIYPRCGMFIGYAESIIAFNRWRCSNAVPVCHG